jgi:alpha-1,3-rhamnosyl/mannosyltransferase
MGRNDDGRPLLRRLRRLVSPRRHREIWSWIGAELRAIRRRRRETRLTIGVDINPFYEPLTGVGWYLRQILVHLAHRDDLRLRLYGHALVEDDPSAAPHVAPPSGPAIEWVFADPRRAPFILHGPVARIFRGLAPWRLAADRNDVLLAPNYLLPPVFRRARGPRVATIHDLAVRKLPDTVRPDTRRALEARLAAALAEATALIVPSEAVRADLAVLAGVPPEKIQAIHHGLGSTSSVTAPRLPPGVAPPFGLQVGTIEPRKNLAVLLAAWRELRKRHPEARLVIAGGPGWRSEEVERDIAAAATEGWLTALGYVAAEELAGLYRAATLVALPSLDEGFGLPAVEALAAGAPLAASDLPVLREVAGDAALYAPPRDVAAWTAVLERLWTDAALRADLRRKGEQRAGDFDWQRAADQTAEVLRGAADRRGEGLRR